VLISISQSVVQSVIVCPPTCQSEGRRGGGYTHTATAANIFGLVATYPRAFCACCPLAFFSVTHALYSLCADICRFALDFSSHAHSARAKEQQQQQQQPA